MSILDDFNKTAKIMIEVNPKTGEYRLNCERINVGLLISTLEDLLNQIYDGKLKGKEGLELIDLEDT